MVDGKMVDGNDDSSGHGMLSSKYASKPHISGTASLGASRRADCTKRANYMAAASERGFSPAHSKVFQDASALAHQKVEANTSETAAKGATAVSRAHLAGHEAQNISSTAHAQVAKAESKANSTETTHTEPDGNSDAPVKMLVKALMASQQQTHTISQNFAQSQRRMESLEDRLSSTNDQKNELEKNLARAHAEISSLQHALGAAEKKNAALAQASPAKPQINTQAGDKVEISRLVSQVKALQFQLSKAAKPASATVAGLLKHFVGYSAKFKTFYENDMLGSRQYADLTKNLHAAQDVAALHEALDKFLTTTSNIFVERSLKNKEIVKNIKNINDQLKETLKNINDQIVSNHPTRHSQLKGLAPGSLNIVQCLHVLHALTEGIAKQPRPFEELLRSGSSEVVKQSSANRKPFLKDCLELSEDPLGRTVGLLLYEVSRNGKLRTMMQHDSKAKVQPGSLK